MRSVRRQPCWGARSAVALAASVLALLTPPIAAAYQSGGGTGTTHAAVATLGNGSTPSTTAATSTVTVRWAQTSFLGSALGAFSGGGYRITRYPAAGGAGSTPAGTCATTVSGGAAELSCEDATLGIGSWRYTVTPVLNSWTGAESTKSPALAVLAAPVVTLTRRDPEAGVEVGALRLDWDPVADAAGYDVYRRTAGGSYGAALNPQPLTSAAYTDTSVSAGTSYAYVVRAVAAGSSGPASAERTATPVARPAAPANVTTTPISAGRMTVAWGSVPAATLGYNVYRRAVGGTYGGVPVNGASPVTSTSYTDTTSVGGTAYHYRVRSVGPGATGAALESSDGTETAAATADATGPSVSLADPGLRLRGSVVLTATASDSSGVASVRIQYAPTGGSTWTTVCTATSTPYACTLDTTALSDGAYDLRAVATDTPGNATTSAIVAARIVDNTVPVGTTGIAADNKPGGTAGRPETGDVISLPFSEPLLSGSVLSGWTGTSTNVTVRFANLALADTVTVVASNGITPIPLGTVATGRDYVLGAVDFTGSTMVASGGTITVTLGTTATPLLVLTSPVAGALTWTIPAGTGVTDLAGNPLAAGTFVEAGAADVDF